MSETTDLNKKVKRLSELISGDRIGFAKLTGTSTGTVAYEVTSTTGVWSLLEVRAHLSAVGAAGTFDVTLDSASSTAYDVQFLSESLSTVTSVFWQPTRPIMIAAADAVDIAWASPTTGAAVTFGFEAVYRRM
jgi:hypothetical protein